MAARTSRRAIHEHFVSGGTGCEFYEVLAVLGLLILSVFNQTLIRSLFRFVLFECKLLRWSADGILLGLPPFIVLVLPDQFMHVCIVLIVLNITAALTLTFVVRRKPKQVTVAYNRTSECSGTLSYHSYFVPLSYVRAWTIGATLFCILAVDFPIFPRRYAKTETHGFSLMDIGVGLFVCIAASLSVLKKEYGFLSEMKSAFWMTVLGLLRLALVTFFEYQAPIMEYGKHLNFFFCFAATKVICAIFYKTFANSLDFFTAVAVYFMYQLALQSQNVHFLLHSPERDGFLMANKEGLASLIGSTCLFLLTSAVVRRFVCNARNCKSDWIHFVVRIMLMSLSCMATALLMHYDTVPISRRLFNLSYSLWVLSIFLIGLVTATITRFIDLASSTGEYDIVTLQHTTKEMDTLDDVVQSVNRGAIWIFLVGNLATGAINKILDGKISKMGATVSVLILFAYGVTLFFFALLIFPKPAPKIDTVKKSE